MQLMDPQTVIASRGRILYDASRLRKPDDELFSVQSWTEMGSVERMAGGRGSIAILRRDEQRWVLRHYRRGGMVAKVSQDRYVWRGEARTRSFAEWRLLARLRELDLPVPAPIAARYVRAGWTYTADLITELLPNVETVARLVAHSSLEPDRWRKIGRTIAAFHAHGVQHADLNAHNILLTRPDPDADPPQTSGLAPPAYLLDFDRGRIRERGAWERQVLSRLRRSLEKVSREAHDKPFDEKQWRWLMEGYEEGERRTADGGR